MADIRRGRSELEKQRSEEMGEEGKEGVLQSQAEMTLQEQMESVSLRGREAHKEAVN